MRSAFGVCLCGIAREEGADGRFVGEDGGGVNICSRHLGVALEDELCVFECAAVVSIVARDAGDLDECSDGIFELGDAADEVERGDVCGELRPGFEAVLSGEDELGVGEAEGGGGEMVEREFVQRGVMAVDAFERGGVGGTVCVQQVFRLFAVLIEVGAVG